MNNCAVCGANAHYVDRASGDYVCQAHARLEVIGPRSKTSLPPLTIRPTTPTDRARIAELASYFWGETEVECFNRTYQVDLLPAAAACSESAIVGVASYALEESTVNLVMLNVLPDWQGQGAARALIAAVQDAARGEGATRMVVATTNDDLPALGLYQRLGFTITEVLPGKLVEHHGGIESGFASIPVRDEIQMEVTL
jgi:ribosomal protein S18 acetylase RimI-like enzyme